MTQPILPLLDPDGPLCGFSSNSRSSSIPNLPHLRALFCRGALHAGVVHTPTLLVLCGILQDECRPLVLGRPIANSSAFNNSPRSAGKGLSWGRVLDPAFFPGSD